MRQILLDTNVLVSYLTDRDPEQQKKAEALFEQAAAGTLALIATATACGHFDAVATFDVPLSRRLRRHGFKVYW